MWRLNVNREYYLMRSVKQANNPNITTLPSQRGSLRMTILSRCLPNVYHNVKDMISQISIGQTITLEHQRHLASNLH